MASKKERTMLNHKDIIWIFLIMFVYGIISFVNLGAFDNPQTFWSPAINGNYAVVSLKDKTFVSKLRQFTGPNFGSYKMYISNDNKNFKYIGLLKQEKVFAWQDIPLNQKFRYMAFKAENPGAFMGDLALYDKENQRAAITFVTENAKVLTDEQDKVPKTISYLNSTYFDEIYHARTAYEHIHDMTAYEWTHPPLGKLIMSIPIYFLGMVPFAYRLMGNLAGITMLAVIYVLAKRLFGSSRYAALSSILLAADGMHFVQTRIATVDSFLVLFIMVAFLFMLQYIQCSERDALRTKLLYLFFSGLFIGAAISVKWNGAYGLSALAFIFFWDLLKRIKNNRHNYLWKKQMLIIFLSCVVFFIIIPGLVYLLSYIPFFRTQFNKVSPLDDFIKLQIRMFKYHSELKATHPYGSPWYLWPLDIKPVWYYKGAVPKGFISSIMVMGNPVIWWSGIAAIFYLLKEIVYYKDKEAVFLIVIIFALYLPYAFISRVMFLYHYFPVVPFLILAVVSMLKCLSEHVKKPRMLIKGYSAAAVICFVFFYPIYSGVTIWVGYAAIARWFPAWQFY